MKKKKKKKNPQVSTYICGFKESFFPIHANPTDIPMVAMGDMKGGRLFFPPPWMIHCGSTQTQFLAFFKRSSPFALEMSPSVAPSQLILFFMALILNAGIREASKSGGGRHTSGGGHAGGTMPVPPWAGPGWASPPLPLHASHQAHS